MAPIHLKSKAKAKNAVYEASAKWTKWAKWGCQNTALKCLSWWNFMVAVARNKLRKNKEAPLVEQTTALEKICELARIRPQINDAPSSIAGSRAL